jgi:hypothetical protein
MRTYGRIPDGAGGLKWVEVQTDPVEGDSLVWLTTLIQCLKLSTGESPFYANNGIPAQRSVIQQVFPDFYVTQTQMFFSKYFASLTVAKIADTTPTYQINLITWQGTKIVEAVPT